VTHFVSAAFQARGPHAAATAFERVFLAPLTPCHEVWRFDNPFFPCIYSIARRTERPPEQSAEQVPTKSSEAMALCGPVRLN